MQLIRSINLLLHGLFVDFQFPNCSLAPEIDLHMKFKDYSL